MIYEYWTFTHDGDGAARAIFNRHYSRKVYKDGRKPRLFVGPGEKMVLVTANYDALFVWRKFISMAAENGVNCAIFRNESFNKSSDMILEAEKIAWDKWQGERLYTYVNPNRIESPNPGYCFKQAGWNYCGKTRRGLHILEKFPN